MRVLVGKVVEREWAAGNDLDLYCDVTIDGLKNGYLTDELYDFSNKRIRITIEVIEE